MREFPHMTLSPLAYISAYRNTSRTILYSLYLRPTWRLAKHVQRVGDYPLPTPEYQYGPRINQSWLADGVGNASNTYRLRIALYFQGWFVRTRSNIYMVSLQSSKKIAGGYDEEFQSICAREVVCFGHLDIPVVTRCCFGNIPVFHLFSHHY